MWICPCCMEANDNEREECKKCQNKKDVSRSSEKIKKCQSAIFGQLPRQETNNEGVSVTKRQPFLRGKDYTQRTEHEGKKVEQCQFAAWAMQQIQQTKQNNCSARYRAVKAFHGSNNDGQRELLFFQKGDIINVVDMCDKYWWNGKHGEVQGWFPAENVVRARQSLTLPREKYTDEEKKVPADRAKTLPLNRPFSLDGKVLEETLPPNRPFSLDGKVLEETLPPNRPFSLDGKVLEETLPPNRPFSLDGKVLEETLPPNRPFSLDGKVLEETLPPNRPFSLDGKVLEETLPPNRPFSLDGKVLEETLPPNRPFSLDGKVLEALVNKNKKASLTVDRQDMDDILMSSELEETEYQDLRIVMVGKTGSGKSATGNSLLGKRHFVSKMIGQSVTKECCRGESEYDGRNIVVIDTPGLFDTKLPTQKIRENIVNCIHMSCPGPHVFLLILQIGRFTGEEIDTFNQLFEIFGEWMADYSIIIFTGLDNLERENRTVESYIEETGEILQKYIDICGGRYFAMNNIASDDRKENMKMGLINKIVDMMKQNNGNHFSNEICNNVKQNIEEAVKEVKQEEEKAIYDEVNQIKQEFDKKIKVIKDEDEVVKRNIDFQTELRKRLSKQKMETKKEISIWYDDFETSSEEETIKASKRENLRKKNMQLEKEAKEVGEKLDLLQTKHAELENIYEEIKFVQDKSILDAQREHKERISEAIKKATEENRRLMISIWTAVNDIDAKLEEIGIQLEDQRDQGNAKYRKLLIGQQKNLHKERQKLMSKQSKYLDKVMQNSSSLEKQLSKKGNICPVM